MVHPTFHYDSPVKAAAFKHGLDWLIVKAICIAESGGRTNAYRYEPEFWLRYLAPNPEYRGMVPERAASSYGLMQVMFSTAKQHGFMGEPEELMVPQAGIEYGCRHLRWLLDRCEGNVRQALAQYNGGERGNVTEPYRNDAYASKVLAIYRDLQKEDTSVSA